MAKKTLSQNCNILKYWLLLATDVIAVLLRTELLTSNLIVRSVPSTHARFLIKTLTIHLNNQVLYLYNSSNLRMLLS